MSWMRAKLFRRPPTELRRSPRSGGMLRAELEAGVTLRLCYRPPYDWAAMLAHLEARAITGVEQVERVYGRTVSNAGVLGTVEVRHQPARNGLAATIRFPSVRALPAILDSVRRLFAVGADIQTIGAHLSQDPFLAPWSRADRAFARRAAGRDSSWPGGPSSASRFRSSRPAGSPGGWSCCAGRACHGNQVQAAGLTHAFPTARQVGAADLGALGMPAARRAALRALAEAAVADPHLFQPLGTVEEAIRRLRSIRGVGEWTVQYIALQALRESDAFPTSDLGLLRRAATGADAPATPADLLRRAEPWRPWRAYAAQPPMPGSSGLQRMFDDWICHRSCTPLSPSPRLRVAPPPERLGRG